MQPRIWLPAIVVFFVVMLLAGLRLTSPTPFVAKTEKGKTVHADPNVANGLLRRLGGPPTSEEDRRP